METNMFGRNLRAIREDKGITQDDLSAMIETSRVSISAWERKGTRPRTQDTIDALCNALNVSEQDLFGFSDGYYAKKMGLSSSIAQSGSTFTASAPVLGNIAAGDPSEAIEMSDETHDLPARIRERFPDGFFLVVHGDSMDKVLPDGCYAYIAPSDSAEIYSGDIVAIKVNGDDATVKRIKLYDDLIILEPESTNPEHQRRVIDSDNPDAPNVRILGKVVWYDYELINL